MSIKEIFFPAEPRDFAGRRALKIALRALHVLCAGILTGSHIFPASPDLRAWWLTLTTISAVALLLLDLHESCVFVLQIRGYLVILKIAVLGLVPRLDATVAAWVLGVLVVVSVLSSHAPSRVRYAVPLGGSYFRGARTKG